MLNLNYNLNAANIERARYTEQETEAFRPFQIQYVIVPAGGGAAAGNNQYDSGSLPMVGIAGNGGVIASGSYCVQPFITYPIVVGKGGAGGIKGTTPSFTGSNGGDSSFFNITAIGGEGGKSQTYLTSSTFAGSGALTSASIANGGSGSQWTYNLPGCLPSPFNPGCHGGELISSSFYAGGGAGIVVSQSFQPAIPIIYDYLIVGGGGAGASRTQLSSIESLSGGGGGAVLSGSWNPFTNDPNWTNYLVNGILTFPINVGAGGISLLNASGTNGTSSSLFGFSAQGGFGANNGNGNPGGNAGTGSSNSNFTTLYTGGIGTFGGGGAGARANGTAGVDLGGGVYDAGDGGNGALWSGSYYGGGGGGAVTPGGGTIYSGTSGLGSSNAGGGGAAAFAAPAENGKSGSVVIKYDTTGLGEFPNRIKGGIITTSGSFRIHTFNSSSNFTIEPYIPILEVEYIVVGGGGAGVNNTDTCNVGATFGGGGGAAITGSFIVEPMVRTYPIVVGAGGVGKYGCNPGIGSAAGESSAFGTKAQGGQSGDSSLVSGGNSGTGSWGLTTAFTGSVSASGAGGAGAAAKGNPVVASSPAGTWTGGNGGSGLQWVDGKYYAGGGYGGTQDATDWSGQYGLTSELIPGTNFYPGRGGAGVPTNSYQLASNGNSGSVVIRYPGTGSKATGGIITWDNVTNYTYHYFTASGNFTLNENTSSLFSSGLPGVGSGNAYFSPSGSLSLTPFTGGAGAASYYNQNGVSGSDGFVAIRYEGLPLAQGGNIVITDHYTYHLFSSSADLYVIGQESNPNINPCP